MNRSDRVKPVIKVAQNRERDAARVFSNAQRAVQLQKDRLDDVRRYREDYRAGFTAQGKAGFSAQQLRTMRGFIEKLDQAVEQQEQAVRAAETELENKKRQWLEKHFRTQALDHMRDRFIADEQRQANRIEQKEADDRSQNHKPDRSTS